MRTPSRTRYVVISTSPHSPHIVREVGAKSRRWTQKANKATFAKLTEAARPKKTTRAEADLSADGEASTPDPVDPARISSPEVTSHAALDGVEVIEVDES